MSIFDDMQEMKGLSDAILNPKEMSKCKREECSKQAHNLEAGYCSSICNIKALESKLAEATERLRNESN